MNRQTLRKLFYAYLITLVVVWALMATAFSIMGPQEVTRPAVAFVAIPVAAAVVLGLLFLKIGIGIFVYHDARKRGMEPIPWVIVAVLIPYFIGLIAYLLVRQSIRVKCPSCGHFTDAESSFCPRCGKELKLLCSTCNQPIAGNASFCSQCGTKVAQAE